MQYIKNFAVRHDQLPAFHATYLILTILAGALLPLGAFGLLVLAHMALDSIKFREAAGYGWGKTAMAVLRESLVDMTLLLLALLFAVYLHHSLPYIAGLSGLYRAEMTILQGLGIVIPKVKILNRFLEAVMHLHLYLATIPKYSRRMKPLEIVCLLCLCVMVVLFALAPTVLGLSMPEFLGILRSQLVPWRM